MDAKQKIFSEIINAIKIENVHTDNFLIPQPEDKRLRTLASMKNDINFCITSIERLIKMTADNDPDNFIKTALWKSCIITYGKCFTDASKSGHGHINVNDSYNQNNELKAIHQKIMETRHNFIAHRGDNEFEELVPFFSQTKSNTIGPKIASFHVKSLRANNLTVDELKEYESAFLHISKYIDTRIDTQFRKVHQRLREKYSQDQILKLQIK